MNESHFLQLINVMDKGKDSLRIVFMMQPLHEHAAYSGSCRGVLFELCLDHCPTLWQHQPDYVQTQLNSCLQRSVVASNAFAEACHVSFVWFKA